MTYEYGKVHKFYVKSGTAHTVYTTGKIREMSGQRMNRHTLLSQMSDPVVSKTANPMGQHLEAVTCLLHGLAHLSELHIFGLNCGPAQLRSGSYPSLSRTFSRALW